MKIISTFSLVKDTQRHSVQIWSGDLMSDRKLRSGTQGGGDIVSSGWKGGHVRIRQTDDAYQKSVILSKKILFF